MKKVFKLTNKHIVLATPLILFTLLSGLYMAITTGSGKVISFIFATGLLILMSVAFFAGWFNMAKTAIIEQDSGEPNMLIKHFVPGVGEYFLPCFGAFIMFIGINILGVSLSLYLGMHFIGDPGISGGALAKALNNTEALKTFLSGLTFEQLIKINLWNILVMAIMSIMYFLMLFYFPEIFFNTKNPFKAFFLSLKNLFSKKIIINIGIYLLIFIINFIISLLSAIFSGNIIMNFIMTLINFYFICAATVGILLYYYNNFVGNKLGQNIDLQI